MAPGPLHNRICTVLAQIEHEQASHMKDQKQAAMGHIVEVDNFWWKFDVLVLRNHLREYMRESGLWEGSSRQSRLGTHITETEEEHKY